MFVVNIRKSRVHPKSNAVTSWKTSHFVELTYLDKKITSVVFAISANPTGYFDYHEKSPYLMSKRNGFRSSLGSKHFHTGFLKTREVTVSVLGLLDQLEFGNNPRNHRGNNSTHFLFQAMACFRDLRTFMRAVFSSSLKSLAIMTSDLFLSAKMRHRDEVARESKLFPMERGMRK
ncbi:hypothetical protein Tco_0484778 [Tanacetum coccineum]